MVLDGPAGRAEVDARPSDGLNLALVSDAPIRVEAAILGDVGTVHHTAWERFPTGSRELATEVRRHQRDLATFLERSRP